MLFFSVQEKEWALQEFKISNNGVIPLNCFENGKPHVLSSEINAKRRSRGIIGCNCSHRLSAATDFLLSTCKMDKFTQYILDSS